MTSRPGDETLGLSITARDGVPLAVFNQAISELMKLWVAQRV